MDLIGATDGEAPTKMGKHEYFITFDGELSTRALGVP
jgi:hypothetical protein